MMQQSDSNTADTDDATNESNVIVSGTITIIDEQMPAHYTI